jgi:hypothetical protein
VSKFRKKPIVVDAFQVTEYFFEVESPDWLMEAIDSGNVFWFRGTGVVEKLFVRTLEGNMKAEVGDWIIKGINGELYPCKPDIFDKTYEKVDP